MAIPTKDFLEKPISDSQMKYDFNRHQYVLEVDYAMFETGLGDLELDMGGKDNVQVYLEMISDVVYAYILDFKDSKFYRRNLYYLSHSKSAKDAIRRLMLDVMKYNEQEGGMMMSYVTGVNLQEVENMNNISDKTMVGIVGDKIVKLTGLAHREFLHDFTIVDEDTVGLEW